MPTHTEPLSVGWIGTGRMGYEMAARLARGGADVLVWNRTRSKAEPLAKHGAKIAANLSELASRDLVFCMVSTWDDVQQVMKGLLEGATQMPRLVIECSSISLEGSAELRRLLAERREDRRAVERPIVAQSARNRFRGIVTNIDRNKVAAVVEVQCGPHRLVSLMTAEAVRELKLAIGTEVVCAVKATNVVVEVPA